MLGGGDRKRDGSCRFRSRSNVSGTSLESLFEEILKFLTVPGVGRLCDIKS